MHTDFDLSGGNTHPSVSKNMVHLLVTYTLFVYSTSHSLIRHSQSNLNPLSKGNLLLTVKRTDFTRDKSLHVSDIEPSILPYSNRNSVL